MNSSVPHGLLGCTHSILQHVNLRLYVLDGIELRLTGLLLGLYRINHIPSNKNRLEEAEDERIERHACKLAHDSMQATFYKAAGNHHMALTAATKAAFSASSSGLAWQGGTREICLGLRV